jgi:hypothetical protein
MNPSDLPELGPIRSYGGRATTYRGHVREQGVPRLWKHTPEELEARGPRMSTTPQHFSIADEWDRAMQRIQNSLGELGGNDPTFRPLAIAFREETEEERERMIHSDLRYPNPMDVLKRMVKWFMDDILKKRNDRGSISRLRFWLRNYPKDERYANFSRRYYRGSELPRRARIPGRKS